MKQTSRKLLTLFASIQLILLKLDLIEQMEVFETLAFTLIQSKIADDGKKYAIIPTTKQVLFPVIQLSKKKI